MLEAHPQAKFKVTDQPYSAPHKCIGCGVDHNYDGTRTFVDTGFSEDFYGAIYICSFCFAEMAMALGFISQDGWNELCQKNIDLNARSLIVEAENDSLRSSVTALASHRCFGPDKPSDVVAAEAAREDRGAPEDVTSDGVGASADSVKSDDSEGLPDVRGTSAVKPVVPRRAVVNRDILSDFDGL